LTEMIGGTRTPRAFFECVDRFGWGSPSDLATLKRTN
jgi:hypothetical protein